jgi:hypothetical protein
MLCGIHSVKIVMTKLVTINAAFKSFEDYHGQNPSSVGFSYEDGGALTAQDRAKVDAITKYQLEHSLWPVFLIEDKTVLPLIAEAWLDLGKWTKDGYPMFKVRGMDGKRMNTPTFKSKAAITLKN